MRTRYDLIIPLGYACSCSQTLRRAGLQLASFPWDWVGLPPPSVRCRAICDGFKDWMNLEDLEWVGKNDTFGHEEVRNRRSGLIILHDFASGVPLEEQYPAIAAKYERRKERLDSCIRASRRVLLVTIDAPVTPKPTSPEECQKAIEIMSRQYPNASFEYLVVNLVEGRTAQNPIDETPLPGIRRLAFDYKSHEPNAPAYGIDVTMLAELLREEYSVREYRTKAEIAAYEAKRRTKRGKKLHRKMEELGAANMAQYVLRRIRRVWRRLACVFGSKALAARAAQRRYAQVLLLGANREPAFRFQDRWGFEDTSLFSSASNGCLGALASAMRRPRAVGEGGFKLDERAHVWRSADFGLEYRGRLQWKEGAKTPTKPQMDDDLADLRARLGRLADKFVEKLANDKETLLVYRLADGEGDNPRLAEMLDGLEDAISALGARNWKLLVVCLESDRSKMPPPSANRVYRCVGAFTPSDHETWGELGDPVGWNAIFTEFAPVPK